MFPNSFSLFFFVSSLGVLSLIRSSSSATYSSAFNTLNVFAGHWDNSSGLTIQPFGSSSKFGCAMGCNAAPSGMCSAVSYNAHSSHCELGTLEDDFVVVHDPGQAANVLIRHSDTQQVSSATHLAPHILIMGGGTTADIEDYSSKTNASTASPAWIPADPTTVAADLSGQQVVWYKDGFFSCITQGSLACYHLPLGGTEWAPKAMLPSLNQMGKMDLVDGVPYFIGEFDGTLEPVIVHYDWANDTWLPGPNLTLPIVTRYHGQVVWSASQVLIIGGLYAGGTTTVNTTMLVDVKSGTVQQMAQTPVALSTPVCAIMVKEFSGDKHVVCTGEFFAVYDPSSNTWSTNPAHDAALVIRAGHVMVTGATRNTAYILGGVDDTAADVMDILVYDFTKDTFGVAGTLMQGRRYFSAVIYNEPI